MDWRWQGLSGIHVEKYFKDEDSSWLVFLHGFGGNSNMWVKQMKFLKDKYNLLLLDLPGHGQSDFGLAGRKITRFEEIADIIVNVLNENNIKKATFICVSLGCLVFGGIILKYPEIVDGAILCGAITGINTVYRGILNALYKIRGLFPYMTILTFFAYLLMPLKEHSKSRKFFIKSGESLGREEFLAWVTLILKDINILKKLKTVKNKILFVTGDEDFFFIKGVKKKCEKINGLELKILEHCGHVCNIQKWREFNSITLNYLGNKLN